MKAIVYRCYGSPEVLVKIHAASVNPLDWHYMRGSPFFMRLGTGLGAPDDVRMGVDFAGTVEAVGRNVEQFSPGDEVFGGGGGAFAEYLTVRADRGLTLKPRNITFEQAASVPIAKVLGAEVTAVCSTRNVEMVGNHSLLSNRKVMTPEGTLVLVGGPKGDWFAPLAGPVKAMVLSPFVDQQFVMLLAQLRREDLATLADLMEAGKIVIDVE